MGLRETKTPDIPTVPEAKGALARFIQAVTETLQVREGRRGDQLDQAVTYRDLVAGGIVTMRGIGQVGGRTGGLAFTPVAGGDDLDLTPPPLLTGLKATPGLKTIFVQWDAPLYQQGHGPAHVEVWGAPYSGTGPLPTFSNATLLDRVQGVLYPHQVQHATKWHYWARNVTVDGVAQPTPTGGTNGVSATAGIDIDATLTDLISAMTDPDSTVTPVLLQADRLYVAPKPDFSQEDAPTGAAAGKVWFQPSTRIYKRWTGSAWEAFTPAVPFIVNVAETVEDGRTIPAGVYMDAAYIRNVSALIARFGDASIDNALIANLDASKLTVGDGTIGGTLKSQNYIAGSIGWRIHRDGSCEFSNLIARGTVYATAGQIGGNSIKTDGVESPNWTTGGYGWRLGSNGDVKVKSSGGTRIFDLGASGVQPVLKIGSVLEILANGTGTINSLTVRGDIKATSLEASIVTAEHIVSKSATSFQEISMMVDDDTWTATDFYMDHAGVASIIQGGSWADSFGAVREVYVGYSDSTSADEPDVFQGGSDGAAMISASFGVGWHRVWSLMKSSAPTGQHLSSCMLLRSYR